MIATRTHTTALAIVAMLLVAAPAANAVMINVNMYASSGGDQNPQDPALLDGPAGGLGETWNQFNTTEESGLLDATGAVTTVGFSNNVGSGWVWNQAGIPDLEMVKAGRAHFGKGADTEHTIEGLTPGALYNIWIASYAHNAWSESERALGEWSTTNPTTTVGTQMIDSRDPPDGPGLNATTWVYGLNYVSFENVEADGNGEIFLLGDAADGTADEPEYGEIFSTRLALSGFQLALAGPSFDPADFNQDGFVDLVDVNLLTAEANLAVGLAVPLADAKFDLNGDATVNGTDLDLWLAAAATIDGYGEAYLKGDTNLDADVDVWDFDGSGDAQVLSSNLGTASGAVWGDGDFNGDDDVDVWDFDGSGDAQVLSSNLGSVITDVGPDAADGTAEALYDPATGELFFDIGSGVAVVGIGSAVMYPGNVDAGSHFGAPIQSTATTLAYFDTGGLPVGEDSVGLVLPPGLTAADMTFSYTPTSGPTQKVDVTIVPEPSTIAMLGILLAIALCWRRRRA